MWWLEGLRYVPPLGELSNLEEGHGQQGDLCKGQSKLDRESLEKLMIILFSLTHEWSEDSVFWYSTVVTDRVDDPAGKPNEAEGGGHLGIEESGGQEDDEEDRDSLQGVLVDSLVAVEDLLGVGVHGWVLHFVELPCSAHHHSLELLTFSNVPFM